jgi:hypothetical protein
LVTSDFEVDSCGSSYDDRSGYHHRQRRRRRRRQPNRLFRVESVKNSSWYRNFTAPGVIRDLTHELSSSDNFGKFCHYFCMPLSKVEALTDSLITCGYVRFPRTRCRQAEFRECAHGAIGNVVSISIGDRCCVSLFLIVVPDMYD